MSLYNEKIIVAIENAVQQQVEASGVTSELHRLDGEKIVDAIIDQLEGFVLVPKEPTEEMMFAGYESKEKTNNLKINYRAMVEAQEQSHERKEHASD